MARGGIAAVRVGFPWPDIEPTRLLGYDWNGADAEVANLAASRVRAMPFLYGTPSWVSGYKFDPPTATDLGRRRWRAFVQTAVHRYGPGGSFWRDHASLPYLPIGNWQMWNEPNFPIFWGGHHASARQYLDLLKLSGEAAHSVDPAAKIVLAGLGPGLARKTQIPSWKYLRRLYRVGAKPFFDVVSDHPYSAGVKGMADQLKNVATVMRRHHDRAPLWVGEIGWTSSRFSKNRLAVGPRRQATLLHRTYKFVIGHRRKLNIQRLFWFDFRDPANASLPGCPGCFKFGLRRHSGTAKPSWRAFRAFTG